MHDRYHILLDYFIILLKLAEKKQKKKNAGHQNDESVVNSSNNAPVDDSQKALTGEVFCVSAALSPCSHFAITQILDRCYY